MSIRSFALASAVAALTAGVAFAGPQSTPNAPPPAQAVETVVVSAAIANQIIAVETSAPAPAPGGTEGGSEPVAVGGTEGSGTVTLLSNGTAVVNVNGQSVTVSSPTISLFLSIFS